MKRLCFGTLMHILYQARNQKVTNNLLCDAIFSTYSQTTESYDSSFRDILKVGMIMYLQMLLLLPGTHLLKMQSEHFKLE